MAYFITGFADYKRVVLEYVLRAAVDVIGGSSRVPMHVFHKMVVLIKKLLLDIPKLCLGIRIR